MPGLPPQLPANPVTKVGSETPALGWCLASPFGCAQTSTADGKDAAVMIRIYIRVAPGPFPGLLVYVLPQLSNLNIFYCSFLAELGLRSGSAANSVSALLLTPAVQNLVNPHQATSSFLAELVFNLHGLWPRVLLSRLAPLLPSVIDLKCLIHVTYCFLL